MAAGRNGIIFQKEIEGLKVSESTLRALPDMKTRHYHETVELFVLMEGERYYFVDRYVYHMKPMSALLIPPGQIHKTSTVMDVPEHRRFLVQYSREAFEEMIRATYGMSYDDFCLRYNGLVNFRTESWERMMEAYGKLKEEFSPEEHYLPMVKQAAYQLLMLYARELDDMRSREESQVEAPVESGVYNTIHQVTRYLNEHYPEDVKLDDLSERFFISRSYLTRSFKETTGITIVQYLTVVRIRQAARLLRETDLAVTEVSDRCGFGDVTYFEKVFRRLRGMTPRSYRKRTRQ